MHKLALSQHSSDAAEEADAYLRRYDDTVDVP
jgi:hypothetical protein